MINFTFKDYEEFKTLFGMQQHGNGAVSRKNKVLMKYLQTREVRDYARKHGVPGLIDIKSMAELKHKILREISLEGEYRFAPANYRLYSDTYETDCRNGLCEDGDMCQIRVIKHEDGRARICKAKPGRLLKSIILEKEFGRCLPEQAVNWLCEEFAADWNAYAAEHTNDYELHVDQNFQDIYDSGCCEGNFHSCMVDEDYWTFYRDAVDASAAYLTNEDGKIVARCIIYDSVFDETGKKWRFAERQYCTGESEELKRLLINKLIAANRIDCYKQIGAGCRDSRAIVDKDGRSLSNLKFRIQCVLDIDDTVSYQDTFKNYDIDAQEANNFGLGFYNLDVTSGVLEGVWDSWNECYCEEVVTVYYHGAEYTCDSNRLDDFYWCECCYRYVHENDICYSDLLDKDFCCEECMEDAEKEYKRANWHYSEYDDDWVEDESDLGTIYELVDGEWRRMTIVQFSLSQLLERGDAQIVGECHYLTSTDDARNAVAELLGAPAEMAQA